MGGWSRARFIAAFGDDRAVGFVKSDDRQRKAVISKGICECRACQLELHFRGEERFRGLGAFQWRIIAHFVLCFCGGGLLCGVSPSSLSHHLVAVKKCYWALPDT